jgi:hypothetical protein
MAWMEGVFNGFSAYEVMADSTLFDAPDGLTVLQVHKIAVKFMNDHPEVLHSHTAVLVLGSLMKAYPVKQPVKK